MSIYGYPKSTTPFLSNLQNSYVFKAIAPTNQTRYSVPIILTKAHVTDFLNAYIHSASIVTDFKFNGYKTYWISNQGRIGKYDSSISSLANEADVQIFANLSYAKATIDDVLLSYLDEVKNSNKKEFYIIHLIGSHGAYKKRYKYKNILFKNAKSISNQYDNTIYHTDYILKEIINKFKNHKILVVYLSDHGEVVSEKKHGHGFRPPFKDEYDIPLVIYSSIKNNRLDKIFLKNKIHYNTENLNYMIDYISYIKDENNVSTSSKIFAVSPDSFFDYKSLKFYNEEE